jgi:hypothetical protein
MFSLKVKSDSTHCGLAVVSFLDVAARYLQVSPSSRASFVVHARAFAVKLRAHSAESKE